MLIAMMVAAAEPIDTWSDCLRVKSLVYAATQETTEIAALATLGACSTEEDVYFAGFYKTPFLERLVAGPRKLNGDFVEGQRVQRREAFESTRLQLIAKIATYRATPKVP